MKESKETQQSSKYVGQRFTVTATEHHLQLGPGKYEVIKIDPRHSGPWGMFSYATVKNLRTGETRKILTK